MPTSEALPDTEAESARRALTELAVAAAGIGTFDWDLVNKTLKWDDRSVELFGYAAEDFDETIEAFNKRLHEDDMTRVSDDLQKAIDACGEFESEYRIVLPGNGVKWIGARGRALADETGTSVRMLGVAWDATARSDAAARMARGIETMSTAFFSLDVNWCFTYVNAEAERVFGSSRQQLLGGNIWEVWPASLNSDFERHYEHTMQTGEPASFDAYYPAPVDAWFEVRTTRTPDGIAVYFLDVTGRHIAQDMAERIAARAQLLDRITAELATTLDSETAAQRLTHLIVPVVADWSVVTLIDDDMQAGAIRGLRSIAAHHRDPALQSVVESYANERLGVLRDDAIIARALERQEAQVIESGAQEVLLQMLEPGRVRHLLEQLAPEAAMVLPLVGREGPIGMLTLCSESSFTQDDLTTAHHIAARAGLVLDNARLYRQQRELAEGLQRSLLSDPVQPETVQVCVRYTPAAQAAQVGGDWYDAFMDPQGSLVLVIGDVVGHNIQAAADMGQVRSIVRTIGADETHGPAEVLRRADRTIETLKTDTTATAIVGRLEQSDGSHTLRWSNAGHPPPVIMHADGTTELLTVEQCDLLLGVNGATERQEHELQLERDSIVLFYTDGLVERRGQQLDAGIERLRTCMQSLAGLDLESLCDRLLEQLVPKQPDDDVALVAIKLHPQD